MYKLGSERIRTHLQISIAVIVVCLMMLAVPWITKSYQQYQQAKHTVLELDALIAMSDLSEVMLAERMPINLFHHSQTEQRDFYLQQLQQHRNFVDGKIVKTANILQAAGFHDIALQLRKQIIPDLRQARDAIDLYMYQPQGQRQQQQFNADIEKLFVVWGNTHQLLKQTLIASQAYGIDSSHHYATFLLICDLQDYASRIAFNIKAAVTFNQPIQNKEQQRSLETYNHAQYLWNLIGNIQPQNERNADFERLHQQVKSEFLNDSQMMLLTLFKESEAGQVYSYSPKQITAVAVQSFTAVLDLQRYILKKRLDMTQKQKDKTQQEFILSCLVVSICLLAVLFTFLYARHQVFLPLILARHMLLDLIDPECKRDLNNSLTLMDTIEKMKETLKQRDALAFRLKNLANTDALTGISNRVALEEYLNLKAYQEQPFEYTALIVLDIDNFKQVNDQYGHLVGDDVIRHIAEQLKANVRSTDLVVRYGGDEFLVILENCVYGDALYIADQMRCVIGHSVIHTEQGELNISVSAGVAVGAASWKTLLAKADQSLLRVKASGKNGVEG